MKIKNLMSGDVITIKPKQTILDATNLMLENDIGSLVVIDKRAPIGIVTDRDIIKSIARKNNVDDSIDVAMTDNVITIRENQTAETAISKMSLHQVRRLVVVDENDQLTGIVSLGDLSSNEYTDQQAGSALSKISIPNETARTSTQFEADVEDFPL